ncbi:hypothetical protein B0H13DRAFT_2364926 [Mycena leptocephala]|nr:hypothetical protein B0H13DRAFT_2364926 [Mycena leptocephala]
MSSTIGDQTSPPGDRNTPEENKGQWTNSPHHWYEDGSIVIRVDGMLYKIHRGILVKVSEVMEAILAIPDGKTADDPDREGTEKLPLFLDGINRQEFNDFLGGYLYRLEWTVEDDEKERVYATLLKLSDLWIINGLSIRNPILGAASGEMDS